MSPKIPKNTRERNKKEEMKEQIKNAVDELPKMMEEEIKQADEKRKQEKKNFSGIDYQAKHYKKNRALMWTMVTIMFCVIMVIWTINLGSVFYDWNKNLKDSLLPDSLKTGKNKFEELFTKSESILNKLSENPAENIPEKKNDIKLDSLVAAIISITSSTANASSTADNIN